jgi:hypothetical protein
MPFTERIIYPTPLFFADKVDYVIIGVNRINKQIYNKHIKTFNIIIKSGDIAWNKTIPIEDLTNFVTRLDEHSTKLALCATQT